MVTVEEWRAFLQRWSDDWLRTDEAFPPAVRRSRWLGYTPATEAQVARLEKRLGYHLPPSFRAFLLTSNGWRRTSLMIEGIRPTTKIEWLEVDDPQRQDATAGGADHEPYDGVEPEEYFTYDDRPFFDKTHLRASLKIADPAAGDPAIRAAAAAALRETKDRRAIDPLTSALNDPDAAVRSQAEMSVRFLRADEQPPTDGVEEAAEQLMAQLRAMGVKLP